MSAQTLASRLSVAALLVAAPMSFGGCSSSTPDAPKPKVSAATPASKASAVTDAPVDRWTRTPPKEPHPVAKGLYRRATALVQGGDLAGAEAIFKQIQAEHPQSRFGRRLQTEGFPIVEAAKMATVFVMFGGAALLFSADSVTP